MRHIAATPRDLRPTVNYEPKPLPTDEVELPPEFQQDAELIAKHNHDIWALGRMREGWTWGEQRNDDLKTHPGLVPYEDLSESEKDYDRRSVLESLKAAICLGFEITPPSAKKD